MNVLRGKGCVLARAVAVAVTCLALQLTPAPASDDVVCGAWSLHGYRIGMFKEVALEVDIENNPRADVAAVNRSGRRITFRYADGGGGKVLFDSDDRVRTIISSRTAPWDRVAPPPKLVRNRWAPPRLFWLDDSCDVGAVGTPKRGTRVTSATELRKEWGRRYHLDGHFHTASSLGLRTTCGFGDGVSCIEWCYDRFGFVGECGLTARYIEARWQHYIVGLATQPWRLPDRPIAPEARRFLDGGGSSGGQTPSARGTSSSGRTRSSFASRSSSSGGAGSRTSTPTYGGGGTRGSSTGGSSGTRSIKRR
jgi:hypothetical protein